MAQDEPLKIDLTPESTHRFLERLLARTGRGREATIPILQGLQREYRHLPEAALQRVSELTGIRLADLIGVATFYHQFRLREAGRHTLRVCHGTACHVKGAEDIHDAVHRQLQVPEGSDTTPDQTFTVERVACLGCCTLAPAVQIDETTYGQLTAATIGTMVEDFLDARHRAVADVDLIQHRPDHRSQGRDSRRSRLLLHGQGQRRVVSFAAPDREGFCHRRGGQTRRLCRACATKPPWWKSAWRAGRTLFYSKVGPDEALRIVRRHFRPLSLRRQLAGWLDRTAGWLGEPGPPKPGKTTGPRWMSPASRSRRFGTTGSHCHGRFRGNGSVGSG